MSDTVKVEVGSPLRGKDAANFWIGVAIVAGGVYLWWNGWFSSFALESGLAASPSEDGLSSPGLVAMTVDTFCLIGVVGLAVFKFARNAIGGLLATFGWTSGAVYQWATAKQTAGREIEALKNHEQRLRDCESAIRSLNAKTGDIPEPPPPRTIEQQLVDALTELNKIKAAEADDGSAA